MSPSKYKMTVLAQIFKLIPRKGPLKTRRQQEQLRFIGSILSYQLLYIFKPLKFQ
jgi:hypothetical protein